MQTRKEFCRNCLYLALAGVSAPMAFSWQKQEEKPKAQSKKEEKKLYAYCGLNCSGCTAYIATQKNDDNLRAETAKKWSTMFKMEVKASDINCDGCPTNSQRIVKYCSICEIRKCAREKKLTSCALCSSYPCDKLTKFLANSPEAKATLESMRKGKT